MVRGDNALGNSMADFIEDTQQQIKAAVLRSLRKVTGNDKLPDVVVSVVVTAEGASVQFHDNYVFETVTAAVAAAKAMGMAGGRAGVIGNTKGAKAELYGDHSAITGARFAAAFEAELQSDRNLPPPSRGRR